jgi:hypothetical protein
MGTSTARMSANRDFGVGCSLPLHSKLLIDAIECLKWKLLRVQLTSDLRGSGKDDTIREFNDEP